MALQPSEESAHCWSGRLAPSASGRARQRVRPSAVAAAAFWLTTQEGQSVHCQATNLIITHVLHWQGKLVSVSDTGRLCCNQTGHSNQVGDIAGVQYLLIVTGCCCHGDELRLLHSVG